MFCLDAVGVTGGDGQHNTADGFPACFYKSLPVTLMSDQSRALNPGVAAEKTGESHVYFCSKEQMKLFCHRDLASAAEQCNFLLSQ